MVQLEPNLFCCGNNLKITDTYNDKLTFQSTKVDRAASSFRHWQEQSQRGGEGGKLHSGLFFFVCLLIVLFFMQNYVRPFLCKCILRFEHEPLCLALLCLSHRLPSIRPFGSPRKSPSIFMSCIHVSVFVST